MSEELDLLLHHELEAARALGLERTLPDDAASPVAPERDFLSNDYLGLARHESVIAAARTALEESGAGARAARLLGGSTTWHSHAESAAADWLGAPAALLFPSGFQANLGVVGALVGRGDALFSDELNHASLIDAARLSRAQVHVHRHLDLAELELNLRLCRGARRRLIVIESVFSMDGDLAPLDRLHELCERHDAWLVVDEAHAAGLLGPEGAGAWAATGRRGVRSRRLAARVVTGGKALGVAGAFVVGSRSLRDLLLQRARSFIYTTAPTPATAAALAAAIGIVRADASRAARTLALAQRLARALDLTAPAAAIVPLRTGSVERTVALRDELARAGFAVGAVRPPTVPVEGSRLRLVAHAGNDEAAVDELARRLCASVARTGNAPDRKPIDRRTRLRFVVGTDTGVGKTVVSALLLRAARGQGRAAYWKPIQTGEEDDAESVRQLAEASDEEILPNLQRFQLAASPHAAAAAEGFQIAADGLDRALQDHVRRLASATLLVELAGGLLVPYRTGAAPWLQSDWIERSAAPVFVVARSGLGTLNHTLLTLEALRARHVPVAALFLVGPPHSSNLATLRELSEVPSLFEVPPFEPLTAAALRGWLEKNDLGALFDAPSK